MTKGKKISVSKPAESPLPVGQPKKRGLTSFLLAAAALAAIAAAVYFIVDGINGWGDEEKVVKRAMSAAEKYSINKRYPEASTKYAYVVSRWGNKEEFKDYVKQAELNLAKVYKEQGENIKAVELYKKLIAENKDVNKDLYAWLMLELGDCYNQMLNGKDALDAYAVVIKDFEGTDWAAEALFGTAETYREMKDQPNAIKYYNLIVAKYNKGFLSAEALTSIGQMYEKDGKIETAIKTYKKVVDNYPDIVTEYAKARYAALSSSGKVK